MAATVKYTEHKSSIRGAIEGFYSDIEELASEMGEWRDNLEEKFSQTEKYSLVSECADSLENITDNGDAPDVISEGDTPEDEVTYTHGKKSSSKSPYPRWLRRDNAVNMVRAAIDAIDARISNLETSLEELDSTEVNEDEVSLAAVEATREHLQNMRDELEQYKQSLEEHADEADGIEFPSAFG